MTITVKNLKPYAQQVAGSTPLLRIDGNVAKPVCSNELKFYEDVLQKVPTLADFVPKYIGRLAIQPSCVDEASQQMSLDEEESEEELILSEKEIQANFLWSYPKLVKKMSKRKAKIVRQKSLSQDEEDSLVYILIEDVAGEFNKPSILDLKVGTQQHSPREPEKKRKSKTAKCRNSTSATLGLRLSGMRTFNEQGEEDFKDKYYGRGLNDLKFKETIRTFVSSRKAGAQYGVVRKQIVSNLVTQLEKLVNVIKTTKIRFYGCSCLIAFPSFDNDKESLAVPHLKIIDFANADLEGSVDGFDQGFVFGLENLKEILLELN